MSAEVMHRRDFLYSGRRVVGTPLRLEWRRVLALAFNAGAWALLMLFARAVLSK